MPIPRLVFKIRDKESKLELATIKGAEPTSLYGIEGFCLHRRDGCRTVWFISHIETGSKVGQGSTKQEAIEDALKKAGSLSGLEDGIRRMREFVRSVDAQG